MLFIKSLAIGFSIAAPVGPIGMLCIQRSLSRGFRSGLATGLGAACADMIYGLLGALGIAGIAAALPALGWRGVCIEADPRLFAHLRHNRPLCANLNAAAGAAHGYATFVYAPRPCRMQH